MNSIGTDEPSGESDTNIGNTLPDDKDKDEKVRLGQCEDLSIRFIKMSKVRDGNWRNKIKS